MTKKQFTIVIIWLIILTIAVIALFVLHFSQQEYLHLIEINIRAIGETI